MKTDCHAKIALQTPLFAELNEAFVVRAVKLGTLVAYDSGNIIFQEGEALHKVGIVISGRAEVRKSAGGSSLLMSFLSKGDLLGAAGLFAQGACVATKVVALDKTEILFITEQTLIALMHEEFALAENFLAYLSERIRFLTKRISSIASPTVSDRLLNYLFDNATNDVYTVVSSYSALAEAISVSRSSLYRVMSELEAEGYIKRSGKNIQLMHNANGLLDEI